MTVGKANQRVIADRVEFVARMLAEIRSLPLASLEEFLADRRNIWAAESCLRRALEALLDLGRHLLAKVFGQAVTEYKRIAEALEKQNVLPKESAHRMRLLAGYRNRLVHFYHEVSAEELYQICRNELGDIEAVRDALICFVKANSHLVDPTI